MSKYHEAVLLVKSDESGTVLVDRYTDLQTQIDGLHEQIGPLETERKQVRDALTAHADREGVDVVSGKDHEARITRHTDIVFPRKTEESVQYKQLDKQLRGTEAWLSVSALDTTALRRIWAGEAPDPGGIMEIIKPFIRKDEPDVRFRRRKKDD